MEGGERSFDPSEVAAVLRPIYAGLRRFAAVVAPLELEPDDLLQEAVARLLASGRWGAIRDVSTYLRTAMVNLAANERRRLGRERRALPRVGAGTHSDATYPSDMDDLERLAPRDRALMYLVEVEGLPIAAAASAVGCSAVVARSRLSRTRRSLRAEIEQESRDE